MKPGARGRLERIVGPQDSAEAFGNAGVAVLATPALCHWFENAAVATVGDQLAPDEATVGTKLTIEHLAATPLGMRVTIDAELIEVDGRRLVFRIEARDQRELVARGTHERFVVNLAHFLDRIRSKSQPVASP